MPSDSTSARALVIGLAGGTGSGKTTVARKLQEAFPDQLQLIPQDAYYKDQAHLELEKRRSTNYDHPLAFDNDLLIEHLDQLIENQPVNQPVYSFITHTRNSTEVIPIKPAKILLVEGILVLDEPRLRERMDIKVFVDTDPDVRFIRRLRRDIVERGRSVDSVIEQYLGQVRPMHTQFVEPTKRFADVIVPEGGSNEVAIDLLMVKIQASI